MFNILCFWVANIEAPVPRVSRNSLGCNYWGSSSLILLRWHEYSLITTLRPGKQAWIRLTRPKMRLGFLGSVLDLPYERTTHCLLETEGQICSHFRVCPWYDSVCNKQSLVGEQVTKTNIQQSTIRQLHLEDPKQNNNWYKECHILSQTSTTRLDNQLQHKVMISNL